MGTIVIEELTTLGGQGAIDGAPVPNLKSYLATTADASTSTSAENITLNANTRFIRVHGVENHRVAINDSTAAAAYGFVPAGTTQDYAVKGGETLYYRLDA
jgi:hypothetical protein